MNTFTKAVILGTLAVATLITTFEVAPAGERFWRRGFHNHGWRYHHGPYYPGRAVAAGVIGLTAGVIVGEALSQPRVVYRDRPDVVVRDDPSYDASLDDGPEYLGPVDGNADPEDDAYVQPRDHRRLDQSREDDRYQDDGQMDDQAQDDGYFPDRPQKHDDRRTANDVAEQGNLEPWTAKWRSYCKQRFSSFNATTGTYKGYDGKSHFCTSGG